MANVLSFLKLMLLMGSITTPILSVFDLIVME